MLSKGLHFVKMLGVTFFCLAWMYSQVYPESVDNVFAASMSTPCTVNTFFIVIGGAVALLIVSKFHTK